MAWSLPEFLEKAQAKWEGKLVAVEKLTEATTALESANARIAELEKASESAEATGNQVRLLLDQVKTKDAELLKAQETISALEASITSAARQAQQQIAAAGAQKPVVTDAPKNPENGGVHPFVAHVRAKVKEGSTLGAAVGHCANKFKDDHKAWLAAGQPSLLS